MASFASQDTNIDGFLMEKLRFDVHGTPGSVVKDEEMSGRAIRYLCSRPSHSVLDTPGQWLLACQAVAGVVKYTGRRSRLGSEICV